MISSAPLGKTGDHAKYVLEKDQHSGNDCFFALPARICRYQNQRIDVSAVLELDEFRQVKTGQMPI